MIVDVVIPAYNEEGTVGKVVGDIKHPDVRNVIVVNNASSDRTSFVAREAGAVVLDQPMRGYGNACLKGIEFVNQSNPPADILAFMDADYSDHPEQLKDVLGPIVRGEADLVIGSRALGDREAGSMTPQQRFGNWLATKMIQWMYKKRFTDLGPFRAMKLNALNAIGMEDKTYGWTVEMQVKAIKHGYQVTEVPVDYRRRGAGKSKVAGTLKGTILAGYKIISTILKYR